MNKPRSDRFVRGGIALPLLTLLPVATFAVSYSVVCGGHPNWKIRPQPVGVYSYALDRIYPFQLSRMTQNVTSVAGVVNRLRLMAL